MSRRQSTIVVFVVAAIAIGVGVWTAQRREQAVAVSSEATALFYQQTLADAAGTARPMSAYRGHVVVVNFWATWCVPCVKEIPAFSKVHADLGGKVAFVGLGIDSPDAIRAFDARFKPSYPLVAAGVSGSDLARAFGNDAGALPFTVVLDADGHVVASHLGQVDEATLQQWLAPYVTGRSASATSASEAIISVARSTP